MTADMVSLTDVRRWLRARADDYDNDLSDAARFALQSAARDLAPALFKAKAKAKAAAARITCPKCGALEANRVGGVSTCTEGHEFVKIGKVRR